MGTNFKLEMTFDASHSDQTYFHSYFHNEFLMAMDNDMYLLWETVFYPCFT